MNHIDDKAIFGSFFLTDTEFAISACYLQEVVNAPTSYISVPLAQPYLKGLFNLRGSIVPVIDLKELLGLKLNSTDHSHKIAIVEFNGTCVGLLFDKTGEVFKNNDDERCDFDQNNSTSVVSGVFKKNGGERIIQILDINQLFQLQNIPKDTSNNRLGRESLIKKRGSRKKSISFVVGSTRCALPISDIQEIIKADKVTDTALIRSNFIGTINLRGSTVPVIDFPALLNYREVDRSKTATHGDRRIIIMRIEKDLFGLLVDSVDSIVSYFPDELVSYAVKEQKRTDMFSGFITGQGEADIILMDNQKIQMNEEIAEITKVHGMLYNSHNRMNENGTSKGSIRRNFITFKLDTTYAVAINEVKEIIDYPKKLIRPPGTREHVVGVHNLRGELVTIIDARSMYQNKNEHTPFDSQKVIVFKNNIIHFGLVVDSVESMASIADNERISLSEFFNPKIGGSMASDVSDVVDAVDNNGQRKSMLILSVEALSQRAAKSIAA